MIISKPLIIANSLENEYAQSISLEHRKKFAQFFTPFSIADLIQCFESYRIFSFKELILI